MTKALVIASALALFGLPALAQNVAPPTTSGDPTYQPRGPSGGQQMGAPSGGSKMATPTTGSTRTTHKRKKRSSSRS